MTAQRPSSLPSSGPCLALFWPRETRGKKKAWRGGKKGGREKGRRGREERRRERRERRERKGERDCQLENAPTVYNMTALHWHDLFRYSLLTYLYFYA